MKNYMIRVCIILMHMSILYAADNNVQPNVTLLHSKEIVLPLAPTIAKRLSHLHLNCFARITNIHNQLGGITITPVDLASRVMFIIDEYTSKCSTPDLATAMERLRPSIIKALAQDDPEVLAELELLGVFDKRMLKSCL